MSSAPACADQAFPLGVIARENKGLFFSLKKDAKRIEQELNEYGVIFIRSGVAVGKSTMVNYLKTNNTKYVEITPPDDEVNYDVGSWVQRIADAHGDTQDLPSESSQRNPDYRLDKLLDSFAQQNTTLVFDEAHHCFACRTLSKALFKVRREGLRVLLFSASAEVTNPQTGKLQTTPSEIKRRLMWRPKLPDVPDVVDQLNRYGVKLDSKSLSFLLNLCAGHYGVIVHALHWISKQQRGETPLQSWDLRTTMEKVRTSMLGLKRWSTDGSFLKSLSDSRAISVNGPYKDENEIPAEFITLLFEGPTTDLTPEIRKTLTIAGFILPEKCKSDKNEVCTYT